MARHDFDQDEERGRYGDWREDDIRAGRPGERRDFSDPPAPPPHFSRFDDAYAQAREHGPGSREHERSYRDRYAPEPPDRRRSVSWDWEGDSRRPIEWSSRRSLSRDAGGADRWSGYGQFDAGSYTGPFTGRGPRGYRRSDERITEDVCEVLTRHGQIDASDLDVHVDDGVVTLQGSVDGRHIKRMVEDVVDDVAGVVDVRNELRVSQWNGSEPWQSSADRHYGRSYDEPGRYSHERDDNRRTAASIARDSASSSGEGRFISSGGSEYRDRAREGMEVVGSDGEAVGDVKEISNNSFLVDRTMARDVFVPFSAIRSMSGHRITLSVMAGEVDDQGWASPDLMGSTTGEIGNH